MTHHRCRYRLTLHIPARDRVLCMRVGATEGCYLLNAVDNRATTRPCTYDSWKTTLDLLGCSVLRVVVSRCSRTIFYSQIHTLNAQGGVVSQVRIVVPGFLLPIITFSDSFKQSEKYVFLCKSASIVSTVPSANVTGCYPAT